MAQVSPQYCPRCGAEVVPQQKFCATCGLPSTTQNFEHGVPPPQNMPAFAARPQLPVSHAPVSQVPFQQAPDPIAPPRKRRLGRNGIILLLVALLLVIIAIGYSVLQGIGVGKPVQAAISTTNINTTVAYAGIDTTILNAQQSQNFLDDPVSASDGMLRVQVQAKNTLKQPVALVYTNIVHLIQPDGKEAAAVHVSANPTIAPGAMQTSNIDFALPTNIKPDQISLRLGAANEAQLDIPLNGHADVSKYAPRIIKIAQSLTYLNINWTLVDVTSQLSFNGQQASKEMRFVTVTFSLDNPLMETVIPGSPYTYMHLKTTSMQVAPTSADMPVSIDSGVSGKTGTATFQISQADSNVTLTLSTQGSSGFDPGKATFQI